MIIGSDDGVGFSKINTSRIRSCSYTYIFSYVGFSYVCVCQKLAYRGRRMAVLLFLIFALTISYCFGYVKLETNWRTLSRLMPRFESPSINEEMNVENEEKFVKRKVALVIGYKGSAYNGLQMERDGKYETIESELMKALLSVRAIAESNFNDTQKISLSRSSRTDKKVHAARLVLSAKLELLENQWLHTESMKLPKLVSLLNSHLPQDIRCFSARKMNQGFRAREAGTWREYEYFFPLNVLHHDANSNCDQVLSAFNTILEKYEGSSSFHNFHRLSAKELGSKKKDNSNNNNEDREYNSQRIYEYWKPISRIMNEKTRTVIYKCNASLFTAKQQDDIDVELVKVTIKGQSFLLHTIRLMMSAAILVQRGVLPEVALDVALQTPFQILFPKAPAEGLVLVDSGFGRNSNGQSYALNPSDHAHVDEVFMSEDEYTTSEVFKIETIIPRVIKDWNKEIREDFLSYQERYAANNDELITTWTNLLQQYKSINTQIQTSQEEREQKRIVKSIEDFNRDLLPLDATFCINVVGLVETDIPSMIIDKKHRFLKKDISHKRFLPNTLATALTIHWNMYPGSTDLLYILRAIASKLVAISARQGDETLPQLTYHELLSYITERKLDYWLKEPVHTLIV